MFKIIGITNRNICKEDYYIQVEKIVKSGIDTLIVREKDLDEGQYEVLAKKIKSICDKENVKCIFHTYEDVAIRLGVDDVHIPLFKLRELTSDKKAKFKELGTSCHSVEEATLAEKLGCTYIIAGHIFETDCKKDLAPRGLQFLRDVSKSVSIPVYAIGGINDENISLISQNGAVGACLMSGLMCNDNLNEYVNILKTNVRG